MGEATCATTAEVEDPCAYVQRTSPVVDVPTKPVPVRMSLEG